MNWSAGFWRVKSKLYDTLRPGFILKAENETVRSLLQQIPSNAIRRVLDVGTGTGNSYRLLDAYTVLKVGLDASLAMLLENRSGGVLVTGSILNAPFRAGTFDLILCVGVSEYLADTALLLQSLHVLLTNKGYLVFTVSPKKKLNYLRLVSGHRLYLRDEMDAENMIKDNRFELVVRAATILQVQFLLRKISS
jgi:SAM-dependent methyltransferase